MLERFRKILRKFDKTNPRCLSGKATARVESCAVAILTKGNTNATDTQEANHMATARHNSKAEIHKAAVTLSKPSASKLDKSLAAGILADIPRKTDSKPPKK